jgi:hypothetical protein
MWHGVLVAMQKHNGLQCLQLPNMLQAAVFQMGHAHFIIKTD